MTDPFAIKIIAIGATAIFGLFLFRTVKWFIKRDDDQINAIKTDIEDEWDLEVAKIKKNKAKKLAKKKKPKKAKPEKSKNVHSEPGDGSRWEEI